MRGEEQEIHAPFGSDDIRGLHERAVAFVDIQDLNWIPDWGYSVALELLEHQWNGHDWVNAIIAISAVSNAIAICLVGDVQGAVDVSEG